MPETSPFRIAPVRSADDLAATIALFRAYARSLDVDLCFQDFEGEMAAMPGKYAPPRGELLLARLPDGTPVGAVALRPLDEPGACEMKRLYVAPEGRGMRLGEALVRETMAAAQSRGYDAILLDTLPSMTAAQSLYRKLGFHEIAPYYDNPVVGAFFMRRAL